MGAAINLEIAKSTLNGSLALTSMLLALMAIVITLLVGEWRRGLTGNPLLTIYKRLLWIIFSVLSLSSVVSITSFLYLSHRSESVFCLIKWSFYALIIALLICSAIFLREVLRTVKGGVNNAQ